MKAELLESREREAKRHREDEETARRIAKLEAEVEKQKSLASAAGAQAAAKAEALAEARADAKRKTDTLRRAIARAEERAEKMKEAAGGRPSSSSGPAPYTEAEIEEFGRVREHDRGPRGPSARLQEGEQGRRSRA